MQFQGERTFAISVDDAYGRLSDAAFLVTCIPDATVTDSPTPDFAQCAVRPNFTFARGSLDVSITVTALKPSSAISFLITSKGIGSSADVEASLVLSPDGGGTKVAWSAAVAKLGGLLKAVPAGLIRGAAQKVIDDVWAGVEAKLSEPEA